jgi:thiamine-monophosphate kinase
MTSTEERRIQLIRALLESTPAKASCGYEASVGVEALDDCAVIPFQSGLDLVVGTDFVRGEGFKLFKLGFLTCLDIGYYLIGANASDLAAMGASPLGATVVLRYTKETDDLHFQEIMQGVVNACQDFSMPLLGGDSGSYDTPVLAATAFGICAHGKALLRSNGRPGELLAITGSIGTAGAAFRYFGSDVASTSPIKSIHDELLVPWKRVRPALDQARLLVDRGLARCAIDTSDGLKIACRQLAIASGVDIVLFEEKLPIPHCVQLVAHALGLEKVALACGDSVDFRLLFTIAPHDLTTVATLFQERGWQLFQIGELRQSVAGPKVTLESPRGLVDLPGIERADV